VEEYTEFCVSKLRECISSECPDFQWGYGEETIEGRNLTTRIDIYGKNNGQVILIQFEMHREGFSTNVIKAAYCLENNPRFREKQILILHVLSPFSEKPERFQYGTEEGSDSEFLKFKHKTETRPSGRQKAYVHKLLCLFLKQRGILDSATTTYEIREWDLDDFPEVRKATIVLPSRGHFPAKTEEAISILARGLGELIKNWQRKQVGSPTSGHLP
jgi:hypothetical protein